MNILELLDCSNLGMKSEYEAGTVLMYANNSKNICKLQFEDVLNVLLKNIFVNNAKEVII